MTEKIEGYYKSLYDKNSDAFNANGHKFQYLYDGRVKLVKDMIKNIATKEIDALDAGCGNGIFFDDAISTVLNINTKDGIDLLEEATKLADKKYNIIKCGSTVELSKYFDKKYDFVNSMEIFSYIKPEERMSFFKEHLEILNSGGYFLLTVTNLNSIYRKILKPEKELFPYYFDKTIIMDLIEKYDTEIVSIKGIDIFNIIHTSSKIADFYCYELSFLLKKK